MLINTNTGEILNIISIDLVNSTINVEIRKNKWTNEYKNLDIHLSELSTKLQDNSIVPRLNCLLTIQYICELCILEKPEYSDYVDCTNYNDWHESNWNYRMYINNENATFLTLNYKNFVDSLYTEPVNPKIAYNGGVLVYLNTINQEALPLLESLNITIENKPI